MSKRIKNFDPYKNELMSIQNDGDLYYVEVRDINWAGRFRTPYECFDAALDSIGRYDVQGKLGELREERYRLQEALTANTKAIDEIHNTVEAVPDLSDELRIKEVAPGLRTWLHRWFDNQDAGDHVRYGITLYHKDLNQDGELDISWTAMDTHKKFVE